MLYVDQPIGTGFSYGTDSVTSTVTAAPYVWTLLQAFYAQFPQYENRNFGIFTESYGMSMFRFPGSLCYCNCETKPNIDRIEGRLRRRRHAS